jgi:Uma2 family endonuclease
MAVLTREAPETQSLFEALARVEGKAEIIHGRVVPMPPTGEEPILTSGEIFVSLHSHARKNKRGRAVPDNAIFRVDLPHRMSFSPDAAFMDRDRSGAMGAIEGAPVFAVEVRSENDYGPGAERAIAAKREDYFAAGTLVVWDVDLLSEEVVRKYTSDRPEEPEVFRRGEIADAEPAVPGWRMPVDELFA